MLARLILILIALPALALAADTGVTNGGRLKFSQSAAAAPTTQQAAAATSTNAAPPPLAAPVDAERMPHELRPDLLLLPRGRSDRRLLRRLGPVRGELQLPQSDRRLLDRTLIDLEA